MKWLSLWSGGLSKEVAATDREAVTSVPLRACLISTFQLRNINRALMFCEAPPYTSLFHPSHTQFSPSVMASLGQSDSLMYDPRKDVQLPEIV